MKFIKTLFSSVFWLLLAGLFAVCLAIAGAAIYFIPGLPDVRQLQSYELQTPLRIYTSDDKLIGEFGDERRMPVDFDEIPPQLIQALLAAEDASYFDHQGVDPKGLARAAVELGATGSIQSGGSTITMQVARNYLLTLDRTYVRKIREILLSLQMERILSKEKIFELYVNKIFLGHRSYGIAAAAKVYYDRELSELSLAEMAMIAGLPKAPSAFNPLTNAERALIRRNWILFRMRELGHIDQAEYEEAVQEPVTAKRHQVQLEVDADYVAEMARQFAVTRFGKERAYTGGYNIHTTLDSRLQPMAQRALANGLIAYDTRHGWRGVEEEDIPRSLAEAQDRTERRGLEEELDESPEVIETARRAAERSETEIDGVDGDVSNWLQVLERTPQLGPLYPAIVVENNGREMRVMIHDGQLLTLDWQALSWARPYRSARSRGASPNNAADIAKPGDLVRVMQRDDESWRLSQLPDAQGSLVVLEPQTGAILALQAGFDFNASKFNRATQALRQSGSIFKPFIYLAGLNSGEMTPASVINDAPIVLRDGSRNLWKPSNSSRDFLGPTRLRVALARSRNLVTIRLLQSLGLSETIDFLGDFGFDKSRLPNGLSLALGSASLTPLEMTQGYAILANGGFRVTPWFIERVTQGEDHNLVEEANPEVACRSCPEGQETVDIDGKSYRIAPRVADEGAVYLLRDMLREVVERGTARGALPLNREDIVGKTGTTNGQRDTWFAGFNNDLAVTVWVGKDDNSSTAEYGAQAALPIWVDFMGQALEGKPESMPERPSSIITRRVDAATGRLLREGQGGGIQELFRADFLPSTQPVRVNKTIEEESSSQGTGTYEAIF
ncbi:penicillin-binding protein 1A [Halomonas halocynthiae]|uniref:penicillin-binding protein 1A n=1 Tax=Halomonas halocynthiae TaxID=176290 RepID=UPI00040AA5A0|nr:penicillin-binding protein 1A [Halomonas halocynthiae]